MSDQLDHFASQVASNFKEKLASELRSRGLEVAIDGENVVVKGGLERELSAPYVYASLQAVGGQMK